MSSSLNDAFILIVEDDPDDAALIEALLNVSLVHAKIHRVVSASEARSYLAGKGPYKDRQLYPLPSLILLDLGLPGSSGFRGRFRGPGLARGKGRGFVDPGHRIHGLRRSGARPEGLRVGSATLHAKGR